MSDENEPTNQEGNTPDPSPSAGGEPQVPKHRFDEINSKVRALQEELRIKNELLNQSQQNRIPQVQAGDEGLGITAEELGMDETAFKAFTRLAEKVADKKVAREAGQYKRHLAGLANDSEEMKFLIKHGKDKDSYLEKVREYKHRHFQMTGSYMDTETAYKLIRFDEMESGRGRQSAQVPDTSHSAPAASGSHTPSTPPATTTGAKKAFHELTIEEQEALLDDGLRSGGPI